MGRNGTSKSTLLILGGVVGALTGLGIAYMLMQRSEKENGEIRLSTGEGVRLGVLVLGLLRQVSELGEKSES